MNLHLFFLSLKKNIINIILLLSVVVWLLFVVFRIIAHERFDYLFLAPEKTDFYIQFQVDEMDGEPLLSHIAYDVLSKYFPFNDPLLARQFLIDIGPTVGIIGFNNKQSIVILAKSSTIPPSLPEGLSSEKVGDLLVFGNDLASYFELLKNPPLNLSKDLVEQYKYKSIWFYSVDQESNGIFTGNPIIGGLHGIPNSNNVSLRLQPLITYSGSNTLIYNDTLIPRDSILSFSAGVPDTFLRAFTFLDKDIFKNFDDVIPFLDHISVSVGMQDDGYRKSFNLELYSGLHDSQNIYDILKERLVENSIDLFPVFRDYGLPDGTIMPEIVLDKDALDISYESNSFTVRVPDKNYSLFVRHRPGVIQIANREKYMSNESMMFLSKIKDACVNSSSNSFSDFIYFSPDENVFSSEKSIFQKSIFSMSGGFLTMERGFVSGCLFE